MAKLKPSIPEPVNTLDGLYATISALKQSVELLHGQRGPRSASAVTWQDLQDFPTVAAAASATIHTETTSITTQGYWENGDGGGATYKLVGSEPTHAGKIMSADGRWWEIVGRELSVRAFGVRADGVTDDTAAAQAAINSPASVLRWPAGTILIGAAGLSMVSNQIWIGEGKFVTIIKLNANPFGEMIVASAKTGWEIRDLTVDYNNKTPPGNNAAIGISGSNWALRRLRIVKMTTLGIIGSNLSGDWTIEDCYIQKDAAATTSNQAILLTPTAGINTGGFITRNTCVNSGMNLSTKFTVITFNTVSGHGYGAGITVEADGNTNLNIIQNNILMSGGIVLDANGYMPSGLENWGGSSAVGGNILYNNGGNGLDQGGGGCSVFGNVIVGNGTGPGAAAGIAARWQDATFNAAHTTYVANVSRDLGSGVQNYGFSVDANNPTYQYVGLNSLNGSTAPANMGTGQFRSFFGHALEGSAVFDPPSLVDGAGTSTTVTVAGATLGDKVAASFSLDLAGVRLFAWVSVANTVTCRFENETGAAVDLGSGTIRVSVHKHSDYAAI